MKVDKIDELRKRFEEIITLYEDIEVWMARDLQKLLGYTEWRNFTKVIERAMETCANSGEEVKDHFVELNKMVEIGLGANRIVRDFMLTRYACYIIAQNGDPKKEPIAFAQSYFALKTRKQELLEDRLKLDDRIRAREKLIDTENKLSKNIYERGVDQIGFGRIRSKGDSVLFGGNSTKQMKEKMGVPKNRPLADFLPTITIKAKDFAAEITNFNVESQNMYGEDQISKEHVKNNKDVRSLLEKRGIKPEELPAEEDIKKIQRRVKSIDKKLLKEDKKLRDE
ncbi:DNA damage-inducible protein D [Chondrinema litorale]|uniref:DNA damage-inducible protein D n=1 Tax=Chondrinema litorale TaxID=2994555 RepID=UPI002543D8D9|nr:DNA damage-inducible protein D [Chondrinema litorale]UZS00168.1 DNA damage-inducible protein D [Chondrinema litorale]